jgi:hypothetical protein
VTALRLSLAMRISMGCGKRRVKGAVLDLNGFGAIGPERIKCGLKRGN